MNLIEKYVYEEVGYCENCKNCPNKAEQDLPVKQIEADHCSDIRNHISPNTKVIEHEQKPKQEVKHGFYDSNCW